MNNSIPLSLRSRLRGCSLGGPILVVALLALVLCAGGCGSANDSTVTNKEVVPARAPIAFAKGRIDIEGGVIRLAGSRDGLVKSVLVEEGDRVKRGQLLAVIDDEQARLALDLAKAESDQARAALPALEVRQRAAEREKDRLAGLLSGQVISQEEYDRVCDQLATAQADLTAAQATVNTAACRVRSAEYELEQRSVRAPLDGLIVRRQARPGDGISTLNVTPLFLFAPESPRIVRAEVEEQFVSVIQPGMVAEVLLEVDESQVFPATVARIGQVFEAKQPTGDPSERLDARTVECVLRLAEQNLRIGQRVLVRFRKPIPLTEK
jgi:RND family efflux transporter MFP subunit